MPALTVTEFRAAQPIFSDSSKYTDSDVTLWLTAADLMVGSERWGDMRGIGMQMYAAHFLATDALMTQEAEAGGVPGLRAGGIASEGGDGVNVSFDVSSTAELDAGHWNQTVYGRRYIRLARMFGMGPVQVGAPGPGVDVSTGAWAGPALW